MAMEVDHYKILGLPTGEEGCKLSHKEIIKAYHSKALELHPDKKRNDPNAHKDFQRLQNSYDILKDEKSRKVYDEKMIKKYKHMKMMSEKLKREKEEKRARDEEEKITKKLKAEIARFRANHAHDKSQFSLEKKIMQQYPIRFQSAGFSRFYCGYQIYEDSVFAKLRKADKRQKT